MKISTRIPSILLFVLLVANSSLKAQGPNFLGIFTKAIGASISNQIINLMSGRILVKGKVHNGNDCCFMITVKLDSKPILPARPCQPLQAFAQFSLGMRTAMAQHDLNTFGNGNNMSPNEIYNALHRIKAVSSSEVQPIIYPLPTGGLIKNEMAPRLSLLADM